jgi:uncharacterized protein (DUF1778 family)
VASKSEQLQIRVTARQKAALKRLARAAGQDVSAYVLSRVLPADAGRVAEIVATLREGAEHRFALAELNDLLAALPSGALPEVAAAIDVSGLTPFLQNYVAAMVEHASRARGSRPPAWIGDVVPLDVPYFVTPLPNLRLHLLRSAPVAFKRRNLFVDATVGARV